MKAEENEDKCLDCEEGVLFRSYVVNEMVVWECSTEGCPSGMENFKDMGDEGWDWLRRYYEEEDG